MKKIVAIALLLCMIFALPGCGQKQTGAADQVQVAEGNQLYTVDYRVTNPMPYPDYSFDHEPTTDELRQMAVKGMRDMLSIEWCTPTFFMYNKTGAASGKTYTHAPGVTYAGLPYTNGDSAIWNWYDYYDQETGVLNFPGDGYAINDVLGNTCTGSIMWGWSVVCDSLDGDYTNFQMTKKHGCIPLGDIQYPDWVDTFADYSTALIIDENGEDVILEAFALCLPADGLASYPQDHGMMVIEPAHVVRNEDGSINADESYLIIQDQRGGAGDAAYTHEINGEKQYFSGRTYAKFTFQKLLDQDYIPCTTAEFIGEKPYNPRNVTFKTTSGEECKNFTDMMTGTLESNYPMCILRTMLVDADGNKTQVAVKYLDKKDVRKGTARVYSMGNYSDVLNTKILEDALASGGSYTLQLEVTVSTGEIFTPISFELAP